ncbi:hypothetical protein BTVI_07438 [Pitangus sulphuratus]|nr:hypothetical protein BTVI_07438 [Pitangus sulphuratus]
MEKTMGKQVVTFQCMEDHVGADTHTAPHGRHCDRADGCALNELQTGEAMQEWLYPEGLQTMKGSIVKQGKSGGTSGGFRASLNKDTKKRNLLLDTDKHILMLYQLVHKS